MPTHGIRLWVGGVPSELELYQRPSCTFAGVMVVLLVLGWFVISCGLFAVLMKAL